MLELSLVESKLAAKSRGIKGYKSVSKERLSSGISKSELAEGKNSFDDERWKNVRKKFNDKRLKKIREDFNELRDRFPKPRIKDIRKNLHDIKNLKNLSTQIIKEIEENIFKLEKRLYNFKKDRYQDEFKHKNIRDIRNLFNGIAFNRIDEDYYRPIRTKDAVNGNYVEYESKGDNDKNVSP